MILWRCALHGASGFSYEPKNRPIHTKQKSNKKKKNNDSATKLFCSWKLETVALQQTRIILGGMPVVKPQHRPTRVLPGYQNICSLLVGIHNQTTSWNI